MNTLDHTIAPRISGGLGMPVSGPAAAPASNGTGSNGTGFNSTGWADAGFAIRERNTRKPSTGTQAWSPPT